MAEVSVTFSNRLNGYNKTEVNQYIREAEQKLQEKSAALAGAQQQVEELRERLNKIIGEDGSIEEKIELYDQLMKKMDGEYTNLLQPAIAKAKAIEEKANAEYAVRMDQARYAAEGIYAETADRIGDIVAQEVDANMDRIYEMIDEHLYNRTLHGKMVFLAKQLYAFGEAVVSAPAKTAQFLYSTSERAVERGKAVKESISAKIESYKAD